MLLHYDTGLAPHKKVYKKIYDRVLYKLKNLGLANKTKKTFIDNFSNN